MTKRPPIVESFAGMCYVLLQCDETHPIAHVRHELIWYPERAMTLADQYLYRPYVRTVVTENPWIISLYDREQVRVVAEDGCWRSPDHQTYGGAASSLFYTLLEIPASIAGEPLDGGKNFRKFLKEYRKRVIKANKIYKVH